MSKRIKTLIKKARKGNAQAMLQLGDYYLYGDNIDIQEATKYYKKAANIRQAEAFLNLSMLYSGEFPEMTNEERYSEWMNQGKVFLKNKNFEKFNVLSDSNEKEYSRKRRFPAILLAVLGPGMYGIHNFYLGYWKKGVVWLLLSIIKDIFLFLANIVIDVDIWTMYCFSVFFQIWAMVDAGRILIGDLKASDGKELR